MIVMVLCVTGEAQTAAARKNTVAIRGRPQDIYLYPAVGPGGHRKLLFVPGDAGCRGFGAEIAQELAKAAYNTYCLDTLRYLRSMTGGTVLSTGDIASDFRQIARWIVPNGHTRLLLVGWSEGAGLDLVAAADELNHDIFSGVIAIGTPETNILAWRWWDAGAWVTKRVPREPTFSSAQFIPKVSPLPLFLIASTSNEYVTPEETRALFSAAREPKQLVVIDAKDHKYRGNTERFLTVLRQALDWIEQYHRPVRHQAIYSGKLSDLKTFLTTRSQRSA
jgi:pimeloyl-ACP methyl ester carboxylesterase